ncbi:MAG: hypothetical protein ACXADY_06125 [Candidatus Hodarchaeales archaeon]|jgi:hypothetical protein
MKNKYIVTTIVLIFSISGNFIIIQGNSIDKNLESRWKINKWNDDIVVAWDWGSTNFQTTNGSYLNYTLTEYDPTNFTHPSKGIIEIGNLTIQTTNNKTGEALVLSIYGWFPGLVTSSSNWNLQKQVAQEAANGQWTLGTLVTSESSYDYEVTSLQAINFTYSQDPNTGNQNTTLIYDKETGVLLEGYTEIQFTDYYFLSLKLVSSDIIVTESITNWSSLTIFLTIIGTGIIWKVKRSKK